MGISKDSKKDTKPEQAKKPNLTKISKIPEPLNTATDERWACQKCGLFTRCKAPFTRPEVPEDWTGKVLIVGEGPVEHADGTHSVFDRRAKKLLRNLWEGAGYRDNDIAMVSSVRCSHGVKTAPSMTQIRACRPYLLKVIKTLGPKYIIAAGATAFRALRNDGNTNITRNRGKDFGGEIL